MAGFKTDDGRPFPVTQVAEFKASVHGKALLEKGDLGAPSCTGCHGSHAAMPPAVASVAQVCRRCHAINGQLFDGSRHKLAFEEHKWPECGQCHGKHAIARPSDALIGDKPGTLCHDCHAQHAKDRPLCDQTASRFRSTLDALRSGRAEVAPHELELAERGLDVEPLSRAIADLDEALQQSRSRVHAFDLSTFEQAAAPANEALAKARQSIAIAHGDHRFRQRGLLAAIGSIGLLALGIALKLREIGRRRNGK
jgi:predicted CXXCH cytochrome family protein